MGFLGDPSNPCRYILGNPTNAADPSGLDPFTTLLTVPEVILGRLGYITGSLLFDGGAIGDTYFVLVVNRGRGIINDGPWGDPISRGYGHFTFLGTSVSGTNKIWSSGGTGFSGKGFWESHGVCNTISGGFPNNDGAGQNAGAVRLIVGTPCDKCIYSIKIRYSIALDTTATSGGASTTTKIPGMSDKKIVVGPQAPTKKRSGAIDVDVEKPTSAYTTVFDYEPSMAHPGGASGVTSSTVEVEIISVRKRPAIN